MSTVLASGKLRVVNVAPPDKAEVQERAKELGLVDGLRVVDRDKASRCYCCKEMQPAGTVRVWVPSFTQRHDPPWSVTESCRVNRWNSPFSDWCLDCALKLSRGHWVKGKPSVGSNPRDDASIVFGICGFLVGVGFGVLATVLVTLG